MGCGSEFRRLNRWGVAVSWKTDQMGCGSELEDLADGVWQ